MDNPKRRSPELAGVLVACVLLLLVVTGGTLFWKPLAGKPGMRKEVPEPVKEPPAPHLQLPVTDTVRSLRLEPPSRPKPRIRPAPVERSAPVAPALRRFPIAEDIPVGMERRYLVKGFGRPNMITSAIEKGSPTETWVYLRRDPETETVVFLINGRVVRANSTVY